MTGRHLAVASEVTSWTWDAAHSHPGGWWKPATVQMHTSIPQAAFLTKTGWPTASAGLAATLSASPQFVKAIQLDIWRCM